MKVILIQEIVTQIQIHGEDAFLITLLLLVLVVPVLLVLVPALIVLEVIHAISHQVIVVHGIVIQQIVVMPDVVGLTDLVTIVLIFPVIVIHGIMMEHFVAMQDVRLMRGELGRRLLIISALRQQDCLRGPTAGPCHYGFIEIQAEMELCSSTARLQVPALSSLWIYIVIHYSFGGIMPTFGVRLRLVPMLGTM